MDNSNHNWCSIKEGVKGFQSLLYEEQTAKLTTAK